MFEYSTAVPVSDQVNATSGDLGALGQLLTGIGALAQPVAQVVSAAQAAKQQVTTNTGDGQKTLTPTLTTAPAVAPDSNRTLLYVGLGLAAVVAVVVIARAGRG